MKRVALHTLGCKLNFAETSTIGRQFADHGYAVVDFHGPSDVYVLNTCSVTERADRECRQLIRRALRQSPDACVIVTGCYAQLRPDDIAAIPGVDAVLGTQEKFRIFDHLPTLAKRGTPQVFVSCIDEASEFSPAFSAEVGGRTRAFLKVQDGCDYNCSFCTIPLARGESRSLPVEGALDQARQLASLGYREIVLTGVNVGDYGRKEGGSLLGLLRALEHVDGIERIRVSSIEPNLLTREMVEFMLGSSKCCDHFHIPLQSGSDTVLRQMRRRYRSSDYRGLVEFIGGHAPEAGIGVDVITGFPGETDDLFAETYRFLADLPVSYLHVFTYSEREHTPAAEMAGAVNPSVRSSRNEQLRLLSRRKRREFHSRFVGRSLPVLFESSPGEGFTTNYIRVEADNGDAALVNTIGPVRLTEASEQGCRGVLTSRMSP